MSQRSDAASDRVSYTASAPPSPATAFTVTFWARLRVDRDDFSTMLRLHSSSGGSTAVNIATGSSGTTPVVVSPGNTGGIIGSDALAVDTWRMLAVTCAGTGASDSKVYTKTIGGSTNVVTGQVSGGAAPDGLTLFGRSAGDSSEWFNGGLAYMRIWSAVLSQAEIEAEWASATIVRTANVWANWPLLTNLTDISGNGRNLTAGSTALSTEDDPPLGTDANANAGHASGTGSAGTPTIQISPAASTAAGTGTAGSATAGVSPAAGSATGSGAAAAPAPSIGISAGHAAATGAAGTAVPGVGAAPDTASGIGAAGGPSLAVGPRAGAATGSGAAGAPTVDTAGSLVTATAGHAAGTGTASTPTVQTTSAPAAVTESGWYGLLSILHEAADERRRDAEDDPEACLDCGEPLRSGPDGELYCSWDGSIWGAGGRRLGRVGAGLFHN